MAIRLISDLHLHASRPALGRAFFAYLAHLPADTEALYILGDFFEAWIGDDDDDAFHLQVQEALKQATGRGLPIYFMHGNRDFMVGDAFCAHTGCSLISDPHVLDYQGQRYLLMHGDSLCIDDVQYQQYRAQIRNPDMISMLRAKPLAERREIAKQLRANSQDAAGNKAEDIMDVNQNEVEKQMREHGIHTLIHGHTHRPQVHNFDIDGEPFRRIVLGDWNLLGWEIILSEKPELHAFAITE